MTLARKPFSFSVWKKAFSYLPCYISSLDLYESLGHSSYQSLWKKEFLPPFIEIPHTADIAYQIHGESFPELLLHAQIALSFRFPFLTEFIASKEVKNLDEVVMALNDLVCEVDKTRGCPFKAVSFHGNLIKLPLGVLQWEMFVDV